MNALDVSDLSFAYGAREALRQVGFSLAPGRFAALLGPNGAGKSTLIALLTRLYDLQHGDIRVAAARCDAARPALRQLGVVFQQSTLDLDLSVEQNLRYHAALHGLSRRQSHLRVDAELARQGLGERRREKVRELNGGHRRRVEMPARCCMNRACCCSTKPASASTRPAAWR
jgi:ABC-2 type transport system ATP-binding protein